MYTRPVFQAVSMEFEQSSCCWVYVGDQAINTGLCGPSPFPTCELGVACVVGVNTPVGPVVVSGYPGG
jgi:hypothetical protein